MKNTFQCLNWRIILMLLLGFLGFKANAQKRGIEFNNLKKKQIDFIKEHKRIRISTNEGKFIEGNFIIADSVTIQIKDRLVKISDITMVRSRPIAVTIGASILVGIGSMLIIGGATDNSKPSPSDGFIQIPTCFYTISTGVMLITNGALLPTYNKGHKAKNWSYRIIIEK
jgi:hypothetical protein